MLRHFNSHVWKDKVCVTTTIPAKSFLLPTSQKQSGKQSPKLSAHPDGAVTPKPHLLSEALCGRKWVCTKTDRLNWQSWFSSTFFKEENRWATNGFICVWYKELYVHGHVLWALPGRGQWGKKFPRTHGEGYPTMPSSARGIPTKTEQLLRLMGWTRIFGSYQCVKIHRKQTGLQVMLKTQAI